MSPNAMTSSASMPRSSHITGERGRLGHPRRADLQHRRRRRPGDHGQVADRLGRAVPVLLVAQLLVPRQQLEDRFGQELGDGRAAAALGHRMAFAVPRLQRVPASVSMANALPGTAARIRSATSRPTSGSMPRRATGRSPATSQTMRRWRSRPARGGRRGRRRPPPSAAAARSRTPRERRARRARPGPAGCTPTRCCPSGPGSRRGRSPPGEVRAASSRRDPMTSSCAPCTVQLRLVHRPVAPRDTTAQVSPHAASRSVSGGATPGTSHSQEAAGTSG